MERERREKLSKAGGDRKTLMERESERQRNKERKKRKEKKRQRKINVTGESFYGSCNDNFTDVY